MLGLLIGCKDKPATDASAQTTAAAPAAAPAPAAKVEPGVVDPAATGSADRPVIHGEKWSDDEEGGKAFIAFKEVWVYVDGEPRGALLLPELPPTMKPAWKDDIEMLDFRPGDPPPHEKKIQVLRWRLADYLRTLGVDLAKIKMVYLHGSGYVAIPGAQFRRFADGITFDFTGNDMGKARFFWPREMKTNTSYDRYGAVSVFINKPLLTLNRHNTAFIDGVEVVGIPYHGAPQRGGFRVYVDNKLAMVIKRNELGSVGRVNPDQKDAEPRWNLRKLLESRGIKGDVVAGDLAISRDIMTLQRVRLDEAYVKDLEFTAGSATSGGILLGKDNLTGNALRLYTRGNVPAAVPVPPLERDWQAAN